MKKIWLWLVLVLLIAALTIPVAAASATLTPSKSSVNAGDTFTIKVSISSATCKKGGIEVSFDSKVFELTDGKCLVSNAVLSDFSAGTKDGVFAFSSATEISGNIFEITLKVKSDAPFGTSNVTVKLILDETETSQSVGITVACNHKYDNNCDATCNVCGATRTAPHSWNAGKMIKEPTCTESGSKELTCNDCGQQKTDTIKANGHAYTNNCDTTCNTCGEKRSITHSYNSKWSSDRSQHWHACTVCGVKKDEAPHIPGDEPTEQNPQTCTVCGYELKAALAHTHVFDEELSMDVIGHWYACAGCDEVKDFEDHVYDDNCDDTCNVCGYIRVAEHVYTEQWEMDTDGHWHECTNCGDQLEKEDHVPGPEATPQTPQLCTVCGFELTPMVGHTHVHNWKSDEEGHWQQCDCGHTVGKPAEHIWDEGVVTLEPGKDQPGIKTYTCVCGKEYTEQIPAVDIPDETEPVTDPLQTQKQEKGFVTIPVWLLVAACIGVVAMCALFLILGMIIGRKQARRFMD